MRLIDADALIKALVRKEPFSDCARVVIAECMVEVQHAPTIEERKTGRWIVQDHNKVFGNITTCLYYYPVCSKCGHTGDFNMNYCPNCGAKMEEKKNAEI